MNICIWPINFFLSTFQIAYGLHLTVNSQIATVLMVSHLIPLALGSFQTYTDVTLHLTEI